METTSGLVTTRKKEEKKTKREYNIGGGWFSAGDVNAEMEEGPEKN